MTTIRSSVRPRSSKQPWGTILKPEFGLGYQKMTEYEIEQTVQRLYTVPTNKKPTYIRHNKHMKREDIDAMLERLTKVEKDKIPERDRRVSFVNLSGHGCSLLLCLERL
ncbi:uncharacterized protein LOC112574541 [Pomacea canaliculata]|uniref:uncharacterized protein LOC112574541 n=1 Tax=Pomacea canaliculata TaxID=400727 RepID=UPI000D72BCF2|nr:uncharacterized protein LOC112574541 [Pomacea canaliculata]XP_025111486.1 uncharacterized protein LOC112574541 [Pomacea canaliculata]